MKKNEKAKPKKKYEKPSLKYFGSVKDLTKTSSAGGPGDGGAAPFDRKGTMSCVTEPPWIEEHRILVGDHVCQNSYKRAIQAHVHPGDTVIDLGGGTGIHTLFALESGAKKVYLIESGDIIELARVIVAQNNFSDRVEFINKDSSAVELTEKADVLISNIGFLHSVKSLPDAAARLLKPGGIMIPGRAVIQIVPYTEPEFFAQKVDLWDSRPYGFDFSSVKRYLVNHPQYLHLKENQILGSAAALPAFDFRDPSCQRLRHELRFEITSEGTIHGLGGWYEFIAGDEILISTRPPMTLSTELWNNFFLPLENPIHVKRGDILETSINIDFQLIEKSALWSWSVRLKTGDTQTLSSLLSYPAITVDQ